MQTNPDRRLQTGRRDRRGIRRSASRVGKVLTETPPSVSIGLPVYNGADYLAVALDSILAQTYSDFELIISDNASSDATQTICEAYAARDSRVRYLRSDVNIGPNPNFMRALGFARGQYFKWIAHDDYHATDYLARCVEVLEANPHAVGVHTLVNVINADGGTVVRYDGGIDGSDSDDVAERLRAMTYRRHSCSAMFGLFRLDALRRSNGLQGEYHACDRAMLAELALLGPILRVDDYLFFNREHQKRYSRNISTQERSQANVERGGWQVSQLLLYQDYRDAVAAHVTVAEDQARCRRVLKRWWWVDGNWIRLLVELISTRIPAFYPFAKRIYLRFSKAPEVQAPS